MTLLCYYCPVPRNRATPFHTIGNRGFILKLENRSGNILERNIERMKTAVEALEEVADFFLGDIGAVVFFGEMSEHHLERIGLTQIEKEFGCVTV
jgi:hypothetical protein